MGRGRPAGQRALSTSRSASQPRTNGLGLADCGHVHERRRVPRQRGVAPRAPQQRQQVGERVGALGAHAQVEAAPRQRAWAVERGKVATWGAS